MPASLFLRAKKEWTCRDCGGLIMRRERYYRRRLLAVCLLCHAASEGVCPGSHLGRLPTPPSHMSGWSGNAYNVAKKR